MWWRRLGVVSCCWGAALHASAEVYFAETFGTGWQSRWVQSQAKGELQGRWTMGTGSRYNDDEGIMASTDARHYGISATFPTFSNRGKSLIIQYEVRDTQETQGQAYTGLCHGGCIRVGPAMEHEEDFDEDTEFNILFGPDKCGQEELTQLVFQHGDRAIKKKVDLPYKNRRLHYFHLYRLVLMPNNTVRLEVDGDRLYQGSLERDWAMAQPRYILDASDRKPADWVEDPMMDDPADAKPSEWVDDRQVPDASAKRPPEWNIDRHGEWQPQLVDNPQWRGSWKPRRIGNPAYHGFWEPRKVPNPQYVPNDELYRYDDFSYVGFECWQLVAGTIFDNVIITDDLSEADAFQAKWAARIVAEKEAQAAEEARQDELEEHGDDDDEL